MEATEKRNQKLLSIGVYGGLQRATVVLFGMATTMILAHKAIEPQEMGVWSLYLIVAAFVELMRHGLLRNAVIKYLNAAGPDNRTEVLCASLFLNIGITALLAIGLCFGAKLIGHYTHAPQLIPMMYWNTLALAALIPFSHFEWLMLSQINFKALFYTYVVRQAVTLALLVGFMLADVDITLNHLVIFYAAGIFSGAVAGFYFNRSQLQLKLIFSGEWIKKLLGFGQYSFGTGVSNLVFRSADAFMVSNIISSTAIVAQQGIAIRVFNLADIPSQMIGDVLFPKSAGLDPDDKVRIRYYYEKSVGASLAVIMPAIIAVLLFSKWLVLLLAGPKYLDAVPYLRLLMVVSLFLCFLKQFGTISDATGHPKINFLFTTFIALVNVICCFGFISRFGLIGAAYALLATHVIAFVISQRILYKRFEIRFYQSFLYAFAFYPQIANMLRQRLAKN